MARQPSAFPLAVSLTGQVFCAHTCEVWGARGAFLRLPGLHGALQGCEPAAQDRGLRTPTGSCARLCLGRVSLPC